MPIGKAPVRRSSAPPSVGPPFDWFCRHEGAAESDLTVGRPSQDRS